MPTIRPALFCVLLLVPIVACARPAPVPGAHLPAASPGAETPAGVTGPRFGHVAVVVLENHEASSILDNPAAPFINMLARDYRLFGRAYAVAHPSLPNYLALVAGSTFGIQSDCSDCFVTAPTVADQLEAAGRSWKAYMEDMPVSCGLHDAGRYAVRHDPFVYFTALRTNPDRCRAHIVPFVELTSDEATGSLPALSWIVPNLCNDMHDCDVASGDRWLAQQLPALLTMPAFQADGLLLVTWDEGTSNLGCCGVGDGGRIVTLAVSTSTRGTGEDDTPVNHYSLLRTVEDAFGLPPLGAAARATPLLR